VAWLRFEQDGVEALATGEQREMPRFAPTSTKMPLLPERDLSTE